MFVLCQCFILIVFYFFCCVQCGGLPTSARQPVCWTYQGIAGRKGPKFFWSSWNAPCLIRLASVMFLALVLHVYLASICFKKLYCPQSCSSVCLHVPTCFQAFVSVCVCTCQVHRGNGMRRWLSRQHPDLRDRSLTRWPLLRAVCALRGACVLPLKCGGDCMTHPG